MFPLAKRQLRTFIIANGVSLFFLLTLLGFMLLPSGIATYSQHCDDPCFPPGKDLLPAVFWICMWMITKHGHEQRPAHCSTASQLTPTQPGWGLQQPIPHFLIMLEVDLTAKRCPQPGESQEMVSSWGTNFTLLMPFKGYYRCPYRSEDLCSYRELNP